MNHLLLLITVWKNKIEFNMLSWSRSIALFLIICNFYILEYLTKNQMVHLMQKLWLWILIANLWQLLSVTNADLLF